MNIAIRLTKVEYGILRELQKKDKRCQKDLKEKVLNDIAQDFN